MFVVVMVFILLVAILPPATVFAGFNYEILYTVRFDANGGSGTMADQVFSLKNSKPQALNANTFTRTGHRFEGWATSATGGKVYDDREVFTGFVANKGTSTTLYAVWSATEGRTYTVRFDANGGLGTMPDQVFVYGERQALRANTFTRVGYTFIGWATAGLLVRTTYNDEEDVINIIPEKVAEVTLYAQWRANEYKVSFYAYARLADFKGSVGPGGSIGIVGHGGSIGPGGSVGTISPGGSVGTISPGGSIGSGGSVGTISPGGSIGPGGLVGPASPGGSVSPGDSDGPVDPGGPVSPDGPASPESPGGPVSPGGPGTLADYSAYSGSMPNQYFTYDQPQALLDNAFARIGYRFNGWSTSVIGAKVYDNKQVVSNITHYDGAQVNLYAVWDAHRYTVKFDVNGGSGSMSNQNFVYDQPQALLASTLTRTGYSFAGWSRSTNNIKEFDDKQVVSNITDRNGEIVHLNAVWEGIKYTVIFHVNNGSGTMANQDFTYGQPQALRANTFTRTGHYLIGWARNPSTIKEYDDQQVVSNLANYNNARVYLYATWAANKYTVRFNANGGTAGPMADQSFTYNLSQPLRSNTFARIGHHFIGWSTTPGGPKVYDNWQTVNNLSAVNNAVVTLYAVWAVNTYTVRFNANGGSGTMAPQSFVCYQSQELRPNTFTRSGHRFVGWAITPSLYVEYNDKDDFSTLPKNGAIITLYAIWAKYEATIWTYFDFGYNTWYDEPVLKSSGTLYGYVADVARRYASLVGLQIHNMYPWYYNSPIDICKGTVTSGNIDTLCTHSGPKHTDLKPTMVNNFKTAHPGNNKITTIYWTAHRVLCDHGTGYIQENRSVSSGFSILNVEREAPEERYVNSTSVLMHELNHQYGVGDHYHEIMANGTCRSGARCSVCGINPRPSTCIMNKGRLNINLTTAMCSGCKEDLITHFENHHKI